MSDEIYCPKCGSSQLSANKKGFSGAKAVGGAILAGPLGVAAGTVGSNKVKITCLKCGHVFNPGEGSDKPYIVPEKQEPLTGWALIIFLILMTIFLIVIFSILF